MAPVPVFTITLWSYDLCVPSQFLPNPSSAPALISLIQPDLLDTRQAAVGLFEQTLPAVSVLLIGRVHQDGHQDSAGIDHNMSLSSCDFLPSIVSSWPPFSVVLTD